MMFEFQNSLLPVNVSGCFFTIAYVSVLGKESHCETEDSCPPVSNACLALGDDAVGDRLPHMRCQV